MSLFTWLRLLNRWRLLVQLAACDRLAASCHGMFDEETRP